MVGGILILSESNVVISFVSEDMLSMQADWKGGTKQHSGRGRGYVRTNSVLSIVMLHHCSIGSPIERCIMH